MIVAKNYIFLFFRIALKFIPHSIKKRIRLDLNFERILQKNYPENQSFHFIQVGGLDGKRFDNLCEFVERRKSKGIIFEPLPDWFARLKENYSYNPEIILINKAVHPHLNHVTLYRTDPALAGQLPDWAAGIASLNKDHHRRAGIDPSYIITERVSSGHLMDLIKEFVQDIKIDLFQCDVEGFDLEILRMIDFRLFSPSIIKFEYVNLTKKEIKESLTLLKEQGYFCFYQYPDIIAVKLKKVLL
jgi:FkbM family methyltransferase